MHNLEESSGQLVGLTEIAEKVAGLAQRQDDFVRELGGSINRANQAATELNQLAVTTKSALETGLVDIRTDTDAGLKAINQALASGFETSRKNLLDGLNQQADQLRTMQQDNRQFYADFEKLLRIKLVEGTSEVRQLIEHERGQIERLMDARTEIVLSKQRSLQTVVWVVGGVLVAMIGALLVRQYS